MWGQISALANEGLGVCAAPKRSCWARLGKSSFGSSSPLKPAKESDLHGHKRAGLNRPMEAWQIARRRGCLKIGNLWPSPANHGGFNQPSCFGVMPTVISPLAEEGQ